MVLENSHLYVDFGNWPFPSSYCDKASGAKVKGVSEENTLGINGESFPLRDLSVNWKESTALVSAGPYSFSLRYELKEKELLCTVTPAGKNIVFLDFSGMTLLLFGADASYAKDTFQHQPWHSPMGRGLHHGRVEAGPIRQAYPQAAGEISVHACGFEKDVCAFLHTDYAVSPLFTRLFPHPSFEERSGAFSLSLYRLYFDLQDVTFDSWDFRVVLTGDQNGDGVVDENDYQLALKPYLKEPDPFYEDTFVYKIMCEVHGNRFTTFQQALEIIREVSRITQNKKQLVFLTGWQYTGHDSGYPSFDQVNPALGTWEELENLVRVAAEQYRATVSVHVNIDDSYREHPGFREDVLTRDIDGSCMQWEMFGNKQSYHINHTKDVRTGGIFERVDSLFSLLPLQGSVHFDAMRNTNYSWEPDEFIGPDKEWYCGIKPIQKYVREKGCDISTESINGMMVEITDVYSHLYHNFKMWPVLYHRTLFGGGNGTDPYSLIIGSNVDIDIMSYMVANGQLLDQIAMYHLLYQYLLNRKMIRHTGAFGKGVSVFEDGTIAEADNSSNFLCVRTGETLAADSSSRFLPLQDGIYIYQQQAGTMVRTLPPEYRGVPLSMQVVNQGEKEVSFQVQQDRFIAYVPEKTLLILKKEN